MLIRSFIGVSTALLLSVSPALAHHAFSADFDRDKPIALDGTVSRVEWTNPHSYVYLDAKDENGTAGNWKVELGSTNELTKQGWTKTSLKVGEHVSMRGWQAKNGSKFANAESITMDTGNKLAAASSYYTNPGAGGALAQNNASDSRAVGTSGKDLPRTASPLPLIGFMGLLSSLAALGLRRVRA